ncbi:MAG: YesL family protein [Firmicutes bacterium]|nr:YesL family protein [Bacillota bacterium]
MFRYGSKFYRLMTLVTNLMLLNLLWLLTSLPLFTIGASLSAMYHVCIQYVTRQDDSLMKIYFKAFKENFKQATLVWIPVSLIGCVIVAEWFYLSNTETGAAWWLAFIVLTGLFFLVSGMIFPMIARYRNTTKAIILNSINLSVRNLFSMICVAILNIVPLVLLLEYTDVFLYLGLFWTFGGFALFAYINAAIVMRIFRKYEEPEEEE